MKSLLIASVCGGVFSLVVGCGGNSANSAPKTEGDVTAPAMPATEAPANFKAQVARGGEVYGQKCASCHGDGGQGAKAPRVVGLAEGALPLDPPATAKFRKSRFVTVADVADFVVKTMPPDAPGSLSAEDYYSILAFDLKANGIDLGEQKLDGALAGTLVIPRK